MVSSIGLSNTLPQASQLQSLLCFSADSGYLSAANLGKSVTSNEYSEP